MKKKKGMGGPRGKCGKEGGKTGDVRADAASANVDGGDVESAAGRSRRDDDNSRPTTVEKKKGGMRKAPERRRRRLSVLRQLRAREGDGGHPRGLHQAMYWIADC